MGIFDKLFSPKQEKETPKAELTTFKDIEKSRFDMGKKREKFF